VAGQVHREVVISFDWEPPSGEPPPEEEVTGLARQAPAQAWKAVVSASQPRTMEDWSTQTLPLSMHVRWAHWIAAQLPHESAADHASMQSAGIVAAVARHEFAQPRKSVGQVHADENRCWQYDPHRSAPGGQPPLPLPEPQPDEPAAAARMAPSPKAIRPKAVPKLARVRISTPSRTP